MFYEGNHQLIELNHDVHCNRGRNGIIAHTHPLGDGKVHIAHQ